MPPQNILQGNAGGRFQLGNFSGARADSEINRRALNISEYNMQAGTCAFLV
jgi:hypothetical protein